MRLMFAGLLTLIAGVCSDVPNSWVVALVGGCMIGMALYRDQIALAALRARQGVPVAQPATAERITRERWRETRERRR